MRRGCLATSSAVGFAAAALVLSGAASPALAQSPLIRGFTPDSGPPGTLVKIIGSRLDHATAITFGGVPAASVLHLASTHVKAVVPEGALSGPIGLVDRDGLHTYTQQPFFVWSSARPRPQLGLATPNPTPATASVTLVFSLSRAGHARLGVCDPRGRWVRSIADGPFDPGPHERLWDGRDAAGRPVAGGIYLLVLEAEGQRLVRRIAWLK